MSHETNGCVLETRDGNFSFVPADGEWVCTGLEVSRIALGRVSVHGAPGLPSWTSSGLRSLVDGLVRVLPVAIGALAGAAWPYPSRKQKVTETYEFLGAVLRGEEEFDLAVWLDSPGDRERQGLGLWFVRISRGRVIGVRRPSIRHRAELRRRWRSAVPALAA
jgi:hypothetical protein